jgi:hypothetical protein
VLPLLSKELLYLTATVGMHSLHKFSDADQQQTMGLVHSLKNEGTFA